MYLDENNMHENETYKVYLKECEGGAICLKIDMKKWGQPQTPAQLCGSSLGWQSSCPAQTCRPREGKARRLDIQSLVPVCIRDSSLFLTVDSRAWFILDIFPPTI